MAAELHHVCLNTMKATIDRLDCLLITSVNGPDDDPKQMIKPKDVRAIRDDLWSAWFELNELKGAVR